MDKKHTGKRPDDAEDTSGAKDGAKRTRVCILMNKSRLITRLQPIRLAKQMSMPVRLRTRGYDGGTARSTRAFLEVARASRNMQKGKLQRATEKRSVTVRQHFVFAPARSPLSHRLPLFYSLRREAVYIALTHINSLSFRTEIPPRFSIYRILLPRIRPMYLLNCSIQ